MNTVPTGNYQPVLGIEAVIQAFKDDFKIEHSQGDITFTRWVNQGVRHIDCLTLFQKKITTLQVKNNIACLPCGFFRMLALRFGAPPFLGTAIYVDTPFANFCTNNAVEGILGGGAEWGGMFAFSNSFQIQGSNIVFNQVRNFDINGDFIEQPITSCTIAYFGFDVDNEGLFNVYADMERALVAYLSWQYCKQNFREYTEGIRNEHRREWIAQKKWLKSNAYYQDFLNTRHQIAEWSNCILSDKNWLP